MHFTHKYSLPALFAEPRSPCRVPGGRRLLHRQLRRRSPAAVPGSDWPPARQQMRGFWYFGGVGGPVPAACPRGTPPLGSRQQGVCPGNTRIVGARPRDMPICRKRSRNGRGRLWKTVFRVVQARPANCQGSSGVGWAGVVLPKKPSPYGWVEGMGAGDGRATPRGSLLTHPGLGLFSATFSLPSFEISQHPPAPTTCHVSKERCGWLPATTEAPNYVKSSVRFLFQRETLKFSPQDLFANPC